MSIVHAPIGVDGLATKIQAVVWYTGDDALVEGQGLCYVRDTGTAADVDGNRDYKVAAASSSNNLDFAGVTDKAHEAKTGGRRVTINLPGSVCFVAVGVDTVVNSTVMTCSVNVDTGRFTFEGFKGEGTAVALQTATNILASDYSATATLDAAGTALTDSGADYVAKGVAVGDIVYILAGEDDATNAVTAAKTTVASITDLNNVVLADSVSDGGTMEVSYYIISGNPRVLAYLQTGDPSGLQNVYQITNGANTGLLVDGMNFIHGGFTISADGTETLADAARNGTRVGINLMADLTTNDYLLTVTNGFKMVGTALANIEWDDADSTAYLEFHLGAWRAIVVNGPTEA